MEIGAKATNFTEVRERMSEKLSRHLTSSTHEVESDLWTFVVLSSNKNYEAGNFTCIILYTKNLSRSCSLVLKVT